MNTLAEKFLTQAERQRVTASVQTAERITSGEIVPAIASSSHSYPLVDMIGGFFLALPFALILTSVVGSAMWLGSMNLLLFLAVISLLYWPAKIMVANAVPLKRFFLLVDQVEEEVEEAAIKTFYNENLSATRDRNGILIYISVLERRVWILADSGINAKIKQSVWLDAVTELTSGIRQGRQADALCAAIARIGEILQKEFPIKPDDQNELNELIILN